MSESGDSGPGRREVAHRLFAAEFEDSEFSYSESDEERAPNYVVTPTGARVNRLFVVGVLTELDQVNEEVLRARIVDPTGPFVVYAGQYQPEALAFLEAVSPPLFVAVTGKARTFEPEDGDRVFTSIRPESISEVDAETRDRWVVQAAEQTLDRVGRLASAKQSGLSGDALQQALLDAGVTESDAAGAALALDYYGTTGDYLQAVRDLSLNAARVVAGERDEAGTLSRSPGDGTDEPLAALATMELDAPDEPSTAEATVDTSGDTGATEESDEPAADSSSTAVADEPDEPAAVDTPSTEAAESPEATGDAEQSTTDAVDSTSEPVETSDSTDTDVEPSTEIEAESPGSGAQTATATEPSTGPESTTADAESTAPESEPVSTENDADEGSSGTLGDFDASADSTDDDEVGDFDTEFELDEDEREEIEAEYGTDFQSGTEVDDAGEADIETPDPEELAEAETSAAAEADAPETVTDTERVADETEASAAADDSEPAGDVDLEDAVMATMQELNDGGGADREAVITEVMDAHGADRDAVEDAVQDALMGGRCYEPDDDKLTPI